MTKANNTCHSPLEGILFTGVGLSRLSEDDLVWLGRLLGDKFGLASDDVEVVPLRRPQAPEVHPFIHPATRADFKEFALTHGYTEARGHRAWNTTSFTAASHGPIHDHRWTHTDARYNGPTWEVRAASDHGPFPSIRRGHIPDEPPAVDLQSVHDRLVASNLSPQAWTRATLQTVHFLAHLVSEKLGLEEPLPRG